MPGPYSAKAFRGNALPVEREARRGLRVIAFDPRERGRGPQPEPAVARLGPKVVLVLVDACDSIVDRTALNLALEDDDFVPAFEVDDDARVALEVLALP